jgi:hypothetical protein
VGVAVGVAFGVGLMALAVFLLYRRRTRIRNEERKTGHGADAPEVRSAGPDVHGASELVAVEKTVPVELEGRGGDRVTEIDGRGVSELASPVAELDGEKKGT